MKTRMHSARCVHVQSLGPSPLPVPGFARPRLSAFGVLGLVCASRASVHVFPFWTGAGALRDPL